MNFKKYIVKKPFLLQLNLVDTGVVIEVSGKINREPFAKREVYTRDVFIGVITSIGLKYLVSNGSVQKLKKKKKPQDRSQEIEDAFEMIFEGLRDVIGEYLESDYVKDWESTGLFKDPVNGRDTEMHNNMTEKAMEEYKKTVVDVSNEKGVNND
jgi:hypothetical protein